MIGGEKGKMKKIKVLVILVFVSALLLSGCFSLNLLPNMDSAAADELYKDTPEEAIEQYLKEKELDPSKPHSYIVVNDYIFMIYGDETYGGYKDEQKGYIMALPLGFKLQSFIPDIPQELIYFVGIVKNRGDYQIELHGYKEVNGISTITENSPIKVYDSNGEELEKLYNEGEEAETCVWITVQNGLADDYAIYADYDGQTYTVIDAKKIKELVG